MRRWWRIKRLQGKTPGDLFMGYVLFPLLGFAGVLCALVVIWILLAVIFEGFFGLDWPGVNIITSEDGT